MEQFILLINGASPKKYIETANRDTHGEIIRFIPGKKWR